MNEKEQNVLLLLKEQNELLQKALTLTENTRLNKTDVEKYVDFIEARQKHFDAMYEIDEKLKESNYDKFLSAASNEFKKAAEDLFNSGKAMAYRLNEHDALIRELVEQIKENFKKEFRSVNEGKNIRNIYSDNGMPHDSYYFNKTK